MGLMDKVLEGMKGFAYDISPPEVKKEFEVRIAEVGEERAEEVMGKVAMEKRKAFVGDGWYGPPVAPWAQERLLKAVGERLEDPAVLEKYKKIAPESMKKTIADVASKIASAVPIAGEIVAGIQIARELPVVGPLVDDAIGKVMEFASDPTKLFEKAQEFIEDIPLIGDVAKKVAGVVDDIIDDVPIVGDVIGGAKDVVKGVGKLLGKLF